MPPKGRLVAAALGFGLVLLEPGCSPGTSPPIGPSGSARGPAPGGQVRHYALTAEAATIELKPGLRVPAWTYNGTVPGPELRVQVGDLVVVTLHNRLPEGTTIHWHGLALPNGQDGVAGITQDPVPPGASATYSFIAPEAGTYWYHSHDDSARQVDRGLYGALVIEPRQETLAAADDVTLVYDDWPLALEVSPTPPPNDFAWVSFVTYTVNGKTGAAIQPLRLTPGRPARLRLVNAGSMRHFLHFEGTSVRIVALDGHEVSGGPPTDLALPLGPGERVDVELTAANHPIWLVLLDALPPAADVPVPILAPGIGVPELPAPKSVPPVPVLDLLFDYPVRALSSMWPVGGVPDVTFTLRLSVVLDPHQTSPSLDGQLYEINGRTFPDTGTLDVRLGQLVEITFVNTSGVDHPMHLHGDAFQVLAIDGRPLTEVIVKDTVVVEPHRSVTVGFRADNPGWWMVHCHELYHSRGGMMTLLRYVGVGRLAELGGPYHGRPD
jgi:FtsP/CotA-like multicopper oxidase with cupredoxin domain